MSGILHTYCMVAGFIAHLCKIERFVWGVYVGYSTVCGMCLLDRALS